MQKKNEESCKILRTTARDKATLFEKWCSANKVTTLQQLKELALLEDFKNLFARENCSLFERRESVYSVFSLMILCSLTGFFFITY